MIHITSDLIILAAAMITGFIIIRKGDPQYLRLFPYFLLFFLMIEYIGRVKQEAYQNNVLYYNLLAAVEFGFFTYFFSQVIPNENIKRILGKTIFVLPLACLINFLFIQGTKAFSTYTFMASSVILIVLAVIYFYQSFNRATATSRFREPSFWINTGILFFFVCTASVIGATNYITVLPMETRKTLSAIILLVSAFFYLTFLIAFLCQINTRKSSSSL
jgi:hypothetical protein